MKVAYYILIIIIIVCYINKFSRNIKQASSRAKVKRYENAHKQTTDMPAAATARPASAGHRSQEKTMRRYEANIERSIKNDYKERRLQKNYLKIDAKSSDECAYAHDEFDEEQSYDEFDEEQSYDDCSYAHDTSYSVRPSDDCAYTHSDIIGTKAVTQMKTNGRSGMVAYKATHGGMRTVPAFSMSGEEIRAGKKVNIVSVRNGIAIVSETMS